MIDTHCHLNYPKLYGNLAQILEQAKKEKVEGIVCIGTALLSHKANTRALEVAKNYSTPKLKIWASVGVYPHEDTKFETQHLLRKLENLITSRRKEIIALGECGLDLNLSLDKGDTAAKMKQRSLEKQIKLFEGQIKLTQQFKLPLIVHSRNSAQKTLDILKKTYPKKIGGVIHSFTYNWEMAQKFINLGFHIGINGIVTFKNAKILQEAVTKTPLRNILLETDAPYLSPEPFRGETNTPARVKLVAEKIALLKNISFEKVIEKTTQNAKEVFGI